MPLFSTKLPYKTRCQLPDCRKITQMVFRENLDGNMINFCSPQHAKLGEDRWEEKKKLNVRLGVEPQQQEEEMVSGNTEDF